MVVVSLKSKPIRIDDEIVDHEWLLTLYIRVKTVINDSDHQYNKNYFRIIFAKNQILKLVISLSACYIIFKPSQRGIYKVPVQSEKQYYLKWASDEYRALKDSNDEYLIKMKQLGMVLLEIRLN